MSAAYISSVESIPHGMGSNRLVCGEFSPGDHVAAQHDLPLSPAGHDLFKDENDGHACGQRTVIAGAFRHLNVEVKIGVSRISIIPAFAHINTQERPGHGLHSGYHVIRRLEAYRNGDTGKQNHSAWENRSKLDDLGWADTALNKRDNSSTLSTRDVSPIRIDIETPLCLNGLFLLISRDAEHLLRVAIIRHRDRETGARDHQRDNTRIHAFPIVRLRNHDGETAGRISQGCDRLASADLLQLDPALVRAIVASVVKRSTISVGRHLIDALALLNTTPFTIGLAASLTLWVATVWALKAVLS